MKTPEWDDETLPGLILTQPEGAPGPYIMESAEVDLVQLYALPLPMNRERAAQSD